VPYGTRAPKEIHTIRRHRRVGLPVPRPTQQVGERGSQLRDRGPPFVPASLRIPLGRTTSPRRAGDPDGVGSFLLPSLVVQRVLPPQVQPNCRYCVLPGTARPARRPVDRLRLLLGPTTGLRSPHRTTNGPGTLLSNPQQRAPVRLRRASLIRLATRENIPIGARDVYSEHGRFYGVVGCGSGIPIVNGHPPLRNTAAVTTRGQGSARLPRSRRPCGGERPSRCDSRSHRQPTSPRLLRHRTRRHRSRPAGRASPRAWVTCGARVAKDEVRA